MDFLSLKNLYLGKITDCYLGYSNDILIREHSASGGIITQLIVFLLKTKQIDGALLCRSIIIENKISYEVKIVTNPDEVLTFSSSVYFDIPLLKYIPEIKQFDGRLAIVGLPCHVQAIRKTMARDQSVAKNIVLLIGLFCGHNSQKELLLDVLNKKGIQERDVSRIVFRKGPWRGTMEVTLTDGSRITFPFQHFSIYQNLFCDSLKKCLHCHDHTAEQSDISCGDAWLPYLKKDPIKHSIIITRNDNVNKIFHEMRRKGVLFLMQIEPEIVFESQKRSIIFHKSMEARSKIGKLLGYSINCPPEYLQKARWNDYLSACMILVTIKICSHKTLRKIFLTLPKFILYPWLFAFKFLTNF